MEVVLKMEHIGGGQDDETVMIGMSGLLYLPHFKSLGRGRVGAED